MTGCLNGTNSKKNLRKKTKKVNFFFKILAFYRKKYYNFYSKINNIQKSESKSHSLVFVRDFGGEKMSSNIETKVTTLLEPVINGIGYDLYDVIYAKEGKDYYLKIIIDKQDGISLEDCEAVNNAINDLLDEVDYIKEQYFLEVSSPGLERLLKKDKHYLAQIGNLINVKLYKAINKQKEIEGILKEYNDNNIIIEVENENIEIEKNNISVARTVYEW